MKFSWINTDIPHYVIAIFTCLWNPEHFFSCERSKRKQGRPKKKQNPIKLKLKLPVIEDKQEGKTEPEISSDPPPVKKKRIRKPPSEKQVGFKYTCDQCQQGFNGKIPLAKHYRDVHLVAKPFKCNECEKTFASIRTLNDHRVVNHTEQSANICDLCGKSFSSVSSFPQHFECLASFIYVDAKDVKSWCFLGLENFCTEQLHKLYLRTAIFDNYSLEKIIQQCAHFTTIRANSCTSWLALP